MSPLRDARKKAGLTQEELARILGVSHVTISKYESGTITLPVNQAKKIARALGVSWDTLYPEDERAQTVGTHTIGLIENAQKSGKPWVKVPSEDFLQLFASLEFKSEDDRIAYYYGRLNDTGRAEATRCFFRHLDEQRKKDVADYVQRLADDPRYTGDTGALLPADTPPKD